MARGQDSDLNLERWEGTLMMMTGEMAGEEGDDHTSTDIIYLLQVTEPAFSLFELHIPHALLHSPLGSGDPVMVTGYRQGEDAIVAVSIASRMAAFGGSSTEGVAGRHRLMMEQVDPNAALAADAAAAEGAPGWKVLQAGFSGLSGGTKMKDWDRKATGSDEEDARNMGDAGMGGGTDSEDDGGDGW